MEFKAKRRTLRISIEDQVYELRFPLMQDLRDYKEAIKNKSDDDQSKMLIEFLESLGLPEAAQMQLEPSDLNEIVGLISDQKKV